MHTSTPIYIRVFIKCNKFSQRPKPIEETPKCRKFSSILNLKVLSLQHTFLDSYVKNKFCLPEFTMLGLPTFLWSELKSAIKSPFLLSLLAYTQEHKNKWQKALCKTKGPATSAISKLFILKITWGIIFSNIWYCRDFQYCPTVWAVAGTSSTEFATLK